MTPFTDSPSENHLPRELTPSSFEEIILPSGRSVQVPKCNLIFQKWLGKQIRDSYNHKAVVDFEGQPLFAELAILRMFQKDGWRGVWADSYRRKYRDDLPEKNSVVQLPDAQDEIIKNIKRRTEKSGGCWDVFVWKRNDVIFAEAKRSRHDALRQNQLLWVQESFALGFTADNFLLIEWVLQNGNKHA